MPSFIVVFLALFPLRSIFGQVRFGGFEGQNPPSGAAGSEEKMLHQTPEAIEQG